MIYSHKFHDQLKLNVDDVVALIAGGLANSLPGEAATTKLRQESMKCFQVSLLAVLIYLIADTGG
jgi:hypothetical protein